MNDLLYPLIGLITVFIIIIIVRKVLEKTMPIVKSWCAICLANTFTWIALFIMYQFGFYTNLTLIALMMGLTILGLYYTIEKVVSKSLLLFRLPFLLTIIAMGHTILAKSVDFQATLLVGGVWIIFTLLYAYRQSPLLQTTITKLVECCKKW